MTVDKLHVIAALADVDDGPPPTQDVLAEAADMSSRIVEWLSVDDLLTVDAVFAFGMGMTLAKQAYDHESHDVLALALIDLCRQILYPEDAQGAGE